MDVFRVSSILVDKLWISQIGSSILVETGLDTSLIRSKGRSDIISCVVTTRNIVAVPGFITVGVGSVVLEDCTADWPPGDGCFWPTRCVNQYIW